MLSDPHERKWYDDHREQILRGLDPEQATEEHYTFITPKDLIRFINPGCYPGGFDMDKKENFYEVYRELFKQIDKEEELEENVGQDHEDAPTFGDAGTYIDDVLAFYRFWEVFGTKKEFTYMDKYDASKGINGRERRIMQSENKKERKKEKINYNQTVRDVLEFVRKRDPRYKAWKKAKEEEKRIKKEREAEKKRKAAIEQQKKLEAYREEMRKHHEAMEELHGEVEETEEEVIICEICDKNFKSKGAFENHCNSKKHKQKMAQFAKVTLLNY